MSRSYRGGLFTAVTTFFVATVGILTVLAIWDGAASYTKHRLEAQHHASEYAAKSQESIEQCTALVNGADIAECVSQVVSASREHERGERDLGAQRDMAQWTWWLLVASWLGLGITLAGVIYVALTLQATRDAVAAANRTADEAKRIGEAQVRAYLSCVSARFKIDRHCLYIFINLRNYGQSPSFGCEVNGELRVWHYVRIGQRKFDVDSSKCLFEGIGPMISAGAEGEAVVVISNVEIGDEYHDGILANTMNIIIGGTIKWADVFDTKSAVNFSLIPDNKSRVVADNGEVNGILEPYNSGEKIT